MQRRLFLMLLAGLSGCGSSPPTHFYTLDPVKPQHPQGGFSATYVDVGKVIVPASLDRLSVVLRTGANQVEVSDQARWAAPLDGMIRRVLAANLAERLGMDRVLAPGDPVPPGPVRTVILNLGEFTGSKQGSVVLDGDWSVQDSAQKVLLTRHVHLARQVGANDITAIAAALSDMLGALSDAMATALAGLGPPPMLSGNAGGEASGGKGGVR